MMHDELPPVWGRRPRACKWTCAVTVAVIAFLFMVTFFTKM